MLSLWGSLGKLAKTASKHVSAPQKKEGLLTMGRKIGALGSKGLV
jgi:hypothetical protein